MKNLLLKRKLNPNVSLAQFLNDIDSLFDILKEEYGGYTYFRPNRFRRAKEHILRRVASDFSFEKAVGILIEELRKVLVDGHFKINGVRLALRNETPIPAEYDYSVRIERHDNYDFIDLKKCLFENEKEKRQLDEFVEFGKEIINEKPLILDLRDNCGGSDIYICEFLQNLLGATPDYPCWFRLRKGKLFEQYLLSLDKRYQLDNFPSIVRSEGTIMPNKKPIFALIDNGVASSGESCVALLKSVESSTLIGESTFGCFSFGNCIRIYLPNSHLEVFFGTGILLYNKNTNIDSVPGFAPDVPSKPEDALGVALDLISKL